MSDKIKKLLLYIGIIGASLASVAYIIIILVLIKGFKVQATSQSLVFALVNAAVGLIIANFLRYQGVAFATALPDNKAIVDKYYAQRTKDKKLHSLTYFWTTNIIKDILTKGCTIVITTFGLIYIVIVGSNDWSLMFLAIVNLILFICFGLIGLNNAYEYYNNVYVNYCKQKIQEVKNDIQ